MQPPEKIKIIQLIHNLGLGGAERIVIDLSNRLDRNTFDVRLLSLLSEKDLASTFINKHELRIIGAKKSIWSFLSAVKTINSIIHREKIAIIHAHLVYSVFVAVILKVISPSLKIIYTPHTVDFKSRFLKFALWLTKPTRNIDILFSGEMKRSYFKKNFTVIENGIPFENYQLRKPKFEKFTFLAIGRLISIKNHELLIQACKVLKDKIGDKFQILIAGDGPLFQELNEKIIENKLSAHIKLLGVRNDISDLCHQSHVFVMPSIHEGLPVAMLEAGATGLPIVATPVGSIPSLIESNKTGFLCDQADFASTMLYTFFNYQTATQYGSALRTLIKEKYSIDAMVQKHVQLYKSLSNYI